MAYAIASLSTSSTSESGLTLYVMTTIPIQITSGSFKTALRATVEHTLVAYSWAASDWLEATGAGESRGTLFSKGDT